MHRVGRGARPAVAARARAAGWVTAEYSMLPGSTRSATTARPRRGKQSGRTQEIQRLIGRSLRAVTDLADDGRGADHRRLRRAPGRRRHPHRVDLRRLRRAARRVLAPRRGQEDGRAPDHRHSAAAISVGIVDALPYLDLDYSEDVRAEVDMNVVMTGAGASSRCRAPPRAQPFSRERARRPARPRRGRHPEIFALQREMLAEPPAPRRP